MEHARSPKRTPMSHAHKRALARGREEGRVVRRYLEAVEHQRPRRGRRRTPDSIRRRLAEVEGEVARADALVRLHLLQEQADLRAELARVEGPADLGRLERAFVKVAKGYGKRKGIGYNAWRAAGVADDVLSRAGISRGD
jgi:hypothetical protein